MNQNGGIMGRLMKLFCMTLVLVSFSFATLAQIKVYPTQPPHTPDSMMQLAYEGAAYLAETGDYAEMNKQAGKFTKGQVLDYSFLLVDDCDTYTFLANPWFPQLVNKVGLLKRMRDANGKYFALNVCIQTEEQPDGVWTDSVIRVPGGSEKDVFRMVHFSTKVEKDGRTFAVVSIGRLIDTPLDELNKLVTPFREKYFQTN